MHAERQGNAAAELGALLPLSPDAYPQALDLVRGLVLVVRMDERAYRAASFLDDRILSPATRGAWLPGQAVAGAARQVANPRPLHFIFHTGHVGSTLLSRLLDETGAVLGLREPLPLRTLADAQDALGGPDSLLSGPQFDAVLEMLLQLWRRGYQGTRAVVVKATSSASRVGGRLLAASRSSRAVYLNLRPEPYLATLLGGTNSGIDLRGHGPGRMRRLLAGRALPTPPLHALTLGEQAALGWLAESLARAEVMAAGGERVLALDFDGLLADLADGLARVLAHFGLPRDDAFLAAVPGNAVLRHYSKAPELPFPPGERARQLEHSRRDNAAEISRGLDWLERMARADGSVASLLEESSR
jgi:hypothetical protein